MEKRIDRSKLRLHTGRKKRHWVDVEEEVTDSRRKWAALDVESDLCVKFWQYWGLFSLIKKCLSSFRERLNSKNHSKSKLYIMFLCRPHKRAIYSWTFSKCVQERMFYEHMDFRFPPIWVLTNSLRKTKQNNFQALANWKDFLQLGYFIWRFEFWVGPSFSKLT